MTPRQFTNMLSLFAIAVVGACGDSTTPDMTQAAVAIQSGDGQTATVGTTLATPAVVRVSRDGGAVAGTAVTWSVTAGGGLVTPTTATTGTDGTASTVWTLGPNPGANSLEATVADASGSPVVFGASGTSATPPMQAAISIGDNFFDPTSSTISAGGTVTWTWGGSVGHNVTFPTGSNSVTQVAGMFARSFATAGSFDYLCTIHGAAMSGTIIVQ
jgi:plastocyanin